MSLIIPLVLLVLAIPLVIAIMRANELFLLRVRAGKLEAVRGRIPKRLLDDIADIVAKGGLEHAELRAVAEGGVARIYVHGERASGPIKQRLRNAIGQWPVAKLRSAPRTQ